jgi:hypothetical protein
MAASFGTSSRSDRLSAAQQCRRPTGRHAGDRQRQTLGRHVIILYAQTDRRGLTRPQRHRRIVAHQEKALDVFRRVVGLDGRRQANRKSGKGRHESISH